MLSYQASSLLSTAELLFIRSSITYLGLSFERLSMKFLSSFFKERDICPGRLAPARTCICPIGDFIV